jgi:pimeloyl-ACP methyl ester carboxylesterase
MIERSELELRDGVRLHVETCGPIDAGVTVVLLHGWCLDRRTWHHQIAALLDQGDVRVVAYDARGHGRSGSTRLRSATLAQLGADLGEVLRAYAKAGPLVLGGHSMGGMTIMEYAELHPADFAERVAGLLFASTTAEGTTHTRYGLPSPVVGVFRAAEQTGAGVLARLGAWNPHQVFLPALQPAVRWLLFGDEFLPGDLQVTMSAFGQASLRSIGGFRTSIGAQQRLETLAALGELPAAVLVGSRDRLTPPACAQAIADALPGAELTVYAGAGHMVILERPAEVSQALLAVTEQALAGHRRRNGYEQAA